MKIMELESKFICVVCGNRVDALFRQYGPTVLKVNNCERCGSVSDKYIEYDPVIIMLDMILLSREAYRHILYNTTFKAYWKLFIVLLLMETYLDWSNNKDYKNELINSSCKIENDLHSTLQNIQLYNMSLDKKYSDSGNKIYNSSTNRNIPTGREKFCQQSGTNLKKHMSSDDPFLTEKGIYLTFLYVCCDMLVFLVAVFILSLFFGTSTRKNKVEFILLLKGLTLGGMGNLFMLPTLIWGTEHDTSIHVPLVLGYVILSSLIIHSVIYECSKTRSFVILTLAFILKISTQTYLRTITKFYY